MYTHTTHEYRIDGKVVNLFELIRHIAREEAEKVVDRILNTKDPWSPPMTGVAIQDASGARINFDPEKHYCVGGVVYEKPKKEKE